MSQSLLNLREKIIVSDEEVYSFFDREESIRKWIERSLDIPLKGGLLFTPFFLLILIIYILIQFNIIK